MISGLIEAMVDKTMYYGHQRVSLSGINCAGGVKRFKVNELIASLDITVDEFAESVLDKVNAGLVELVSHTGVILHGVSKTTIKDVVSGNTDIKMYMMKPGLICRDVQKPVRHRDMKDVIREFE